MSFKVVATNRKARHNYFLEDTYEAGISLKGSEIKSIRAGQISIKEAYVQIENFEAWLINAHIAPYKQASYLGHDPRRNIVHQDLKDVRLSCRLDNPGSESVR